MAHHAGPVILVHYIVSNFAVIIVEHAHHHTGVEILEHLDDDESRSDGSDEHKRGGHQEEEYFEVKSVKNGENLDCEIFSLFSSQGKQRKLFHLFLTALSHTETSILSHTHNHTLIYTYMGQDPRQGAQVYSTIVDIVGV